MPKMTRETGNGTVKSGTNGDDILSGLGGSFILSGGNGNDIYTVDDSGDIVDEKNNGGTDLVVSYIDWTLGRHVENLTLEGSQDLAGTGNDSANVITGNSGANALYGLGGDDTLEGGAGSDLIDGGSGSDTAVFAGLVGDYSLTWNGGELWVTNRIGETDILRNVEFLSFGGQVIAVSDIAGGPVAVDDAEAGVEDSPIVIPVLSNDLGQGISVAAATNGAMGLVIVNSDGTVTYRPNANATGTDSFTYTITDALGRTSTASVTVEVVDVNDAPLARADSYAVPAGEVFTSSGSVLSNDSDPDGDVLRVSGYQATSAGGGTVQMNPDGTFSYTPLAGFTGTDSFSYTVDDGNGGQASATVTLAVEAAQEPPYYVSALIHSQDWRRLNYPDDLGAPVTVTYTFLDSVPDYYSASSPIRDSFQPFTDQQMLITREILSQIESFTNITFVEVDSAGEATITFGLYDLEGDTGGSATFPVGTSTGDVYGDVWIDTDLAGEAITVATRAFYVLVHELGHAAGLIHPDLPGFEDNRQYSVMDGTPHPTMSGEVTGYQLYDIAALQYLYGANTSHANGNDVYAFAAFDGAIRTIWDGGGHDVLDMSAATYAVRLDLAEGAFSTVAASGSNNLAIAFGTLIEDAIGGAYDDRIFGNDAANMIDGGGGNDVLTGRGGADTFAFAGNWGDDTITDFVRGLDLLDFSSAGLSFGDLQITSSGGDTVISYAGDSVTLLGVATIGEGDFLVA